MDINYPGEGEGLPLCMPLVLTYSYLYSDACTIDNIAIITVLIDSSCVLIDRYLDEYSGSVGQAQGNVLLAFFCRGKRGENGLRVQSSGNRDGFYSAS